MSLHPRREAAQDRAGAPAAAALALLALFAVLGACGADAPVPASDAGPALDAGPLAPSRDGGLLVSDAGRAFDGGGPIIRPDSAAPPAGDCEPNRFVTAAAVGGGDGSEASPWTLEEAMQNAVAGHRVQVAPGIYSGRATGERYVPTFAPAHSGTAEAPIVFCAQYPAVYHEDRPELWSDIRNDGPAPGDPACSPAFGIHQQDYIVWDGFAVDQANAPWRPDTGPVVMVGSSHSQIRRCRVVVQPRPFYDNGPGIRIDYSQYLSITDNRIVCGPDAQNGQVAIQSYDSGFYEWAHNEIEGCQTGLFPKGVHYDPTRPTQWLIPGSVHHNLVTRARFGFFVMNPYAVDAELGPDDYIDVYQNVFRDGENGASMNPIDGSGGRRVRFVNNTIVALDTTRGTGISVQWSPAPSNFERSVWRNNIVVGASAPYGFEASGMDAYAGLQRLSYDYNHFFDVRAIVVNTDGAGFESEVDTLAAWQALGHDLHSSVGADPLFENFAARDLRLAAGSPCRNVAPDFLNLLGGGTDALISQGAYITPDQSDIIGIR